MKTVLTGDGIQYNLLLPVLVFLQCKKFDHLYRSSEYDKIRSVGCLYLLSKWTYQPTVSVIEALLHKQIFWFHTNFSSPSYSNWTRLFIVYSQSYHKTLLLIFPLLAAFLHYPRRLPHLTPILGLLIFRLSKHKIKF